MFSSDKGLLQPSELLMIYNDKTWIRIRSLSLLYNILSSNFTFNRWKQPWFLQFPTPALRPWVPFFEISPAEMMTLAANFVCLSYTCHEKLDSKGIGLFNPPKWCVWPCAGNKHGVLMKELIALIVQLYNLILSYCCDY